jgi:NADH-quinone oxidoreductase subunit A
VLENYLPILLFIMVGLAFGIGPIIAGGLLAPHRPDSEKLSPYECGFEAFEDARMKFDVRYSWLPLFICSIPKSFLTWAIVLEEIGLAAVS